MENTTQESLASQGKLLASFLSAGYTVKKNRNSGEIQISNHTVKNSENENTKIEVRINPEVTELSTGNVSIPLTELEKTEDVATHILTLIAKAEEEAAEDAKAYAQFKKLQAEGKIPVLEN